MSAPSVVAETTSGETRHGPSLMVGVCRWGIAWFFRILTRPGRWALAKAVAWFWFDIVRFRRRLILDNLAIAFPDWTHAQRRAVGRRSLEHLCYTAIETCLLPFFNLSNFQEHITVHGRDILDQALAQGRGAFLAGIHLGNVEKLMAAAGLAGYKAHVIAKKFRRPFLTELVFGLRESFGVRFIDPHSRRTAYEILLACQRNEIVVFVIDQFMRKQYGVETTFFGRTTGTAYGLALFALKTNSPVLPIYSYRDDTDRLHIVVEEPVPLATGESRQEIIRATTQHYNDRIEAIIRRHPEQWMWVHRRWKKFV